MGRWIGGLSLLETLGVCGAFFVALTAVSLVAGYAIQARYQRLGRKVFDLKLKRGQTRKEALGTALFHLVWVPAVALAIWSGALRFDTGWALELSTFAACFYGFQVFYWLMHRAMHTRALFFVHRWHHESLVTTPLTGFSMSPLEAAGWTVGFLLPPLVLSQLWAVGAWGLAAYLVFSWYGNIVGHSNAELMPELASTRWGSRLVGNPISYHCLHHARFDNHYGFGAALMDAIFGTQWDDWAAVSQRVRGGKPLTKLREKVEVDG